MLQLLRIETLRSWRMFLRYPVDAIALIFVMLFMFFGLFLGAEYLAGGAEKFGDRLQSIVILYVTWTLVVSVFAGVSGELQKEADTGTLEQLLIARVNLPTLIFVRAIASLGVSIVLTVVTLGIVILGTGVELLFPAVVLIPIIACVLGGIGLGMLVGSITLLAKRAMGLIGILQLVLLFLITLPWESWTGLSKVAGYFLPLTSGASQIKQMMSGQLIALGSEHAFAFASGVSYFLVGYLMFSLATSRAQKLGLLSQH
ncbi:ABC transporter permease [Pseudoalteromonas aurantia]|uniref:ABC transporter n=1 Tax=Pseudoalteromonas aurantia TaxID=43654 RepID=A0A5S3V6W5_9GAMM|nr:ABC transporter permease [Pseudoalteromonas aurantia]TMO67015.1 ABC transporter [Pseudoalteromonas aurantia]TMO67382.1 ABC transporter [Pseudoalteromonas aurantia]TMO74719.1 ABC transporter [Pseudoalteromonas aurantia]